MSDVTKESAPTVDSMYAEYKISRLWLTIEDFICLYPEILPDQLIELGRRFNTEMGIDLYNPIG